MEVKFVGSPAEDVLQIVKVEKRAYGIRFFKMDDNSWIPECDVEGGDSLVKDDLICVNSKGDMESIKHDLWLEGIKGIALALQVALNEGEGIDKEDIEMVEKLRQSFIKDS